MSGAEKRGNKQPKFSRCARFAVLVGLLAVAIAFINERRKANAIFNMEPARLIHIPQLLSKGDAQRLMEGVVIAGVHTVYTDERGRHNGNVNLGVEVPFNQTLYGERGCPLGLTLVGNGSTCAMAQRFDVGRNYAITGGRLGLKEDPATLGSRTDYFRLTYYHNGVYRTTGMEPLLQNPRFIQAAKDLYNATVVEPYIVFSNLMIPGQLLTVHTDVPAFRGIDRMNTPEWLCAMMHHSGLFEDYRIKIATGVSWWKAPEEDGSHGGEFVSFPYYPASNVPELIDTVDNTAVVLDTDSVFHAVDMVKPHPSTGKTWKTSTLPPNRVHLLAPVDDKVGASSPDTNSSFATVKDKAWQLSNNVDGATQLFRWKDLRISLSWKAYCYKDEAERELVNSHRDDLTLQKVLDVLHADLIKRGVLKPGQPMPQGTKLGELLTSTYGSFPAPNTWIPFNYCILPVVLPWTGPLLSVFGC